MKAPFDFVIEPKGNRYNNTTKVGDKDLIINTEIFNHQFVNREADVKSIPTDFKTKIQCSGGPTRPVPGGNHRCTGEKGKQRFREMVKLYLRSGGRCVVTGKKIKLSEI